MRLRLLGHLRRLPVVDRSPCEHRGPQDGRRGRRARGHRASRCGADRDRPARRRPAALAARSTRSARRAGARALTRAPARRSACCGGIRRVRTGGRRPGERCEMCAEPIADEHHARRRPREPRADVHLPAPATCCSPPRAPRCATGRCPTATCPSPTSRSPRGLGRPADPGRPGVLLPQLGARTGWSRSTRARPAPPSPSCRWTPGTQVLAANPALDAARPTSRRCWCAARPGAGAGFACHLVPIDACYELVGRMRQLWRGFDGGQEARGRLDAFFAEVAARSRPPVTGDGRCCDFDFRARRRRRAVRRRAARCCVRLRITESTGAGCTRSRCAARSASSRSGAATTDDGAAGLPTCSATGTLAATPSSRSCGCTCRTMVPGFTGATEVDLALPCTYDFDVAGGGTCTRSATARSR